MTETEPRPSCAGFTLLELLIAISLFGLIAVLLHTGLRFGVRAWETQEAAGGRRAELQVVQELLRRQFERTRIPEAIAVGRDDRAAFAGTEQLVTFVAPLPARLALGGLYRQSLFLDRERSVGRLIMTWELERSPQDGDRPLPGKQQAVLLEPVEEFRISYYGLQEEGFGEERKVWLGFWDRSRSLPDLVRLRLRIDQDDEDLWSEVVVRLPLAVDLDQGHADDRTQDQ